MMANPAKKVILIIGLGGLGVPALMDLLHATAHPLILQLILVDPDPIELSNLPRQVIYREDQIGVAKVIAAASYAAQVAAAISVEICIERLTSANAADFIGRASFVIDGTDDPLTKFLINDTCVAWGVPFVYGGVLGTSGQAMTILPGETACLRCLFEGPPADEDAASCRDAGIIGPVAGAIGAVQAAEARRYLRGAAPELAGRILTYDGARGRARTVEISRRAGCACNPSEQHCRVAVAAS